ncbi:MAG TPA: NUDIX hydrolase [Alphaproteobacteria bacterium]|nr:NUDIX hydrolase [Alphaproteobacteria bacterium]HAM46310.1 NUDIX hydrolase [Alphaproteobacteria bacterium]HBA42305.1 NUDIX hydrolase [Alphaproteobacteria bacterium]HBC53011.1 NUDIX hydrolase [Alphaproteobacteria bacterium]HCO91021.1 NUDIX hydrolase [Alphaproteobacteria bacterium]
MSQQKSQNTQQIKKPGRAVRPKDASTLIIVRRDRAVPEILMGRRSDGHDFLPNKFVFPGGRVDRGDNMVKPHSDLRPEVQSRLLKGCSPTKARALGMAAVRETFEETGLIVGRHTGQPMATRSAVWTSFSQGGVAPALDIMSYIGRAITPPFRHKRFDARFFMTDAEHIAGDLHELSDASGELLEIHWLPVSEAKLLELQGITLLMLDEVERRVNLTERKAAELPVPFYYFRNGKRIAEAH